MAGYIGSKASVVSSGAERKKTFTITGATTSLTGLNYTVGKVHVFQNGVRLVDGTDYTATNGTTITLTVAAQSGDNVVVVSQASYQVALSGIDDQSNAVAMTIDSNENIGIGTSSPERALHVNSGTGNNVAVFQSTDADARVEIRDSGSSQGYNTISVTANQMYFGTNNTERMRIDSSGNVGIGLTPSSWWSGMNAVETQASSGGVFASASVNGHFLTNAYYDGSNWKYKNNGAAEYYSQSGGSHQFSTASSGSAGGNITWSERMRIDSSGNLLVGTTVQPSASTGGSGFMATSHNRRILYLGMTTTADNSLAVFVNGNGIVGSIRTSGSATSYVTSSDYRLKENVVDLTGASARVNQLNPSRFNFIADDTNTAVDGFLAHEVATVVPEAITGTKDAMRDEEYEVTPAVEATYDEDGNELTAAVDAVMGTRSVPDYQGIDQSKLVPLLTAALQEALTEIASLKTRVEALEA